MEGSDALQELDAPPPAALVPLSDLDRTALASHCVAVAHHLQAMARLFNPDVKVAASDRQKAKKAHGGEEDKAKPKREPSAYNLFIQSRLGEIKAAVRASRFLSWQGARCRPLARRGGLLRRAAGCWRIECGVTSMRCCCYACRLQALTRSCAPQNPNMPHTEAFAEAAHAVRRAALPSQLVPVAALHTAHAMPPIDVRAVWRVCVFALLVCSGSTRPKTRARTSRCAAPRLHD